MTTGSGGGAPGERIRPAMPHIGQLLHGETVPDVRSWRLSNTITDSRLFPSCGSLEVPYLSAMTKIAALPDRGTLAVAGEDRVAFLQGLVSNDVAEVAPGRAVWAALLTPQGKWLADFFILADGDRLLLDCERAQMAMLRQKLTRFRLRSRATVDDGDHDVFVAWDGVQEFAGVAAPD